MRQLLRRTSLTAAVQVAARLFTFSSVQSVQRRADFRFRRVQISTKSKMNGFIPDHHEAAPVHLRFRRLGRLSALTHCMASTHAQIGAVDPYLHARFPRISEVIFIKLAIREK